MGIFKVEHFVDFVGRLDSSSKRVISWTYMVADNSSGSSGREQHEVVLTWSVSSGKRCIQIDGLEESYVIDKGGIVDQKLSTSFGHELHIIGTKVAPDNAHSIFRCYELLINGQSFFTYPEAAHARGKGLTHIPSGYGSGPTSILQILYPDQSFEGTNNGNNPQYENSPRRRSAQCTTQETAPAPAPAAEVDLLDFSTPAIPAPMPAAPMPAAPMPAAPMPTAPMPVGPPPDVPMSAIPGVVNSQNPPFESYQKTPPNVPLPEPTENMIGMVVSADSSSNNGNDSPITTVTTKTYVATTNPFATQATTDMKPQMVASNDLPTVPLTNPFSLNDTRDDHAMTQPKAPNVETGNVMFDPFS